MQTISVRLKRYPTALARSGNATASAARFACNTPRSVISP